MLIGLLTTKWDVQQQYWCIRTHTPRLEMESEISTKIFCCFGTQWRVMIVPDKRTYNSIARTGENRCEKYFTVRRFLYKYFLTENQ